MAGVEFGTVATMTADAKFPNLQFKFPQTQTPESVVPQINQNCTCLALFCESLVLRSYLI